MTETEFEIFRHKVACKIDELDWAINCEDGATNEEKIERTKVVFQGFVELLPDYYKLVEN